MTMIIDAHAHIYDILTGYGARGEFRPLGNGKGIWANGDVEQFFPAEYGDLGFRSEALLRLMDEAGIGHAVLLQAGNYGFHNHYAAETAKRYPKRFTASVTADPYTARSREVLGHFIQSYGIHVLKFELSKAWGLRSYHPELTLDAEVMDPLLAIADRERMALVVDPGPAEDMEAEADAFLRIRDRFPNLTIVMAHCFFPKGDGKNDLRLHLLEKLADADIHSDITNHLCLWRIHPLSPEAIDYLQGVCQAVGVHRMVWGTDVPGVLRSTSYPEMIAAVRNTGVFSPAELDCIMCENAKRIYRIEL